MKKKIWLLALGLIFLVGCGSESSNEAGSKSSESSTTQIVEVAGEEEGDKTSEVTTTEEVQPTEDGNSSATKVDGIETLTTPFKKIATYDYAVADIFEEMDMDDQVEMALPTKTLPRYLEDYAAATDIGNSKEPDFEALKAFAPEVIFVGEGMEAFTKQLSEIAPVVQLKTDYSKYVESVNENARVLGKLYGETDDIEESIYENAQVVEEVQGQTSSSQETSLVLVTRGDEIRAFAEGSKLGWLYTEMGLTPADKELAKDEDGVVVDGSYIEKINPDRIFYMDLSDVAEGSNKGELTLLEGISQVKASQTGKIKKIDADAYVTSGGLRGIRELGEALRKIVSE